jgi:rod shape-determining protein MreC
MLSTRSLEGVPERLGVTIAGFFQRSFSAVSLFVSDTIDSIAELRRLRADYLEIAAKLERYTRLERGMAELSEENARLKEQLGFSEHLNYSKVTARIVAKDPENLYSTITIDKGIESGVRKNMPVIAVQDGMEGLVGRVVDVGHGSSLVMPLYDSTSFVAARLSKARHEGLVGGSGSVDEPLVMRFVKKRAKDDVQFGDLVVTSGFESIYPPEISVGRVRKIRVLDYQTSVEIDLDPVLDFSRLEYVFVVMSQANPEGQRTPAAAAASTAKSAQGVKP